MCFYGSMIIYFLHKILPSQLLKFQRRYFEILTEHSDSILHQKNIILLSRRLFSKQLIFIYVIISTEYATGRIREAFSAIIYIIIQDEKQVNKQDNEQDDEQDSKQVGGKNERI